jgi:hypothetical protein
MRTASKFNVEVIDETAFIKRFCSEVEIPVGTEPKFIEKYGIVRTDGGTFLLTGEGEGCAIPIESKVDFIDVEASMGRYTINNPVLEVGITVDNLKELPIKETVSLDKFIRTFGSRLEENFKEWNDFLSKQIKITA